ncbi:MAG: hypothetical protein WC967_09250 [Balneolaceae bacterium]
MKLPSSVKSVVAKTSNSVKSALGKKIESSDNAKAKNIANAILGGKSATGSANIEYGTESSIKNQVAKAIQLAEKEYQSTDLSPYMITFYFQEVGKDIKVIKGFLPENIGFDLSSTYSAIFDRNVFSGNTVGSVLRTAGISGVTKEMTFRVWESSGYLNFSLPIVFDLADDIFVQGQPYVKTPKEILSEFANRVLPSRKEDKIFLTPPGPTLSFDFNWDSITSAFTSEQETSSGTNTPESQKNEQASKARQAGAAFEKTLVQARNALGSQLSYDKFYSVQLGSFLTIDNIVIDSVAPSFDTIVAYDLNPMRMVLTVSFSTTMIPTAEDMQKYLFGELLNVDDLV